MIHGDLGISLWARQAVTDEIAGHMRPTIGLTVIVLAPGAGLAVPLGVAMAKLHGKGWGVALQIGSVAGLTIPWFDIESCCLLPRRG